MTAIKLFGRASLPNHICVVWEDHKYNTSEKGHARYLRYYYAHRDQVLEYQREHREDRNLLARERRRTRRIIEYHL